MAQYMTDNEITDLIETLSCIYEDYLDLGVDPTSVASVMLAVAVKQLQKALAQLKFPLCFVGFDLLPIK